MNRKAKGRLQLMAALIIFIATAAVILYMTVLPRVEDNAQQEQWKGKTLLDLYRENPDLVGWLQVDGTKINYPVMNSDRYLYRNFKDEYDDSGSLFVEDGWSEEAKASLVYGHNMWMYGTMFNPLHKFEEKDFFDERRTIRFYVITNGGASAEKRTYEITNCIKTDISEWNYASCQYIETAEDLDAFLEDCDTRSFLKREAEQDQKHIIVLSTCSYHIKGKNGRLLVIGKLQNSCPDEIRI